MAEPWYGKQLDEELKQLAAILERLGVCPWEAKPLVKFLRKKYGEKPKRSLKEALTTDSTPIFYAFRSFYDNEVRRDEYCEEKKERELFEERHESSRFKTGCSDQNGREIREGDIVIDLEGRTLDVVVYNIIDCRFDLAHNSDSDYDPLHQYGDSSNMLIVIGDVFHDGGKFPELANVYLWDLAGRLEQQSAKVNAHKNKSLA